MRGKHLAILQGADSYFDGILPIAKRDKRGPLFSMGDIRHAVQNLIVVNDYFYKRTKTMTQDTELAIERTQKVEAEFSKVVSQFMLTESKVVEHSKKASGAIREAADKLASGLTRIEKAANFDRLEKYVELLERAATAMNSLAALEESGKLGKIAGALK